LGKHLLADTLVAVLGHGMRYFMSQYHGQFIVRRYEFHQAFVHHNFSAGHTECVDFVTLYQIEFPGEILDFSRKSTNATQTAMVLRVGKNIATATERYLRSNGLSAEIKDFSWEFNLVKSDEINAFCMPGGKIVVYEGLMKLVSSDDELAVVLGHEVAHAVAKHSNERISQQMLAQYGAQLLGESLSQKSEIVQAIASTVYGVGAQYGVTLPFSRKHETEADYMGLILMTMAGYNPDKAVTFWQKMSASSGGKVPEFMSTHPSDARRISDIQKELPAIKAKYRK
jgi:predicted Zn-dependent protease